MLWCDGGSRGNPGPAAVGYVLEDERGRLLEELGEQIGVATATEAECRALIAGLKRVVSLGLSRLEVRLDAEVIAAHVRGEQTLDGHRARRLLAEVKELAASIDAVSFRWIPRAENGRANALVWLALTESNRGQATP